MKNKKLLILKKSKEIEREKCLFYFENLSDVGKLMDPIPFCCLLVAVELALVQPIDDGNWEWSIEFGLLDGRKEERGLKQGIAESSAGSHERRPLRLILSIRNTHGRPRLTLTRRPFPICCLLCSLGDFSFDETLLFVSFFLSFVLLLLLYFC